MWQDISSAPKDGKQVILRRKGYQSASGHFNIALQQWVTLPVNCGSSFEEVWKEEGYEYKPDEWQPLPE